MSILCTRKYGYSKVSKEDPDELKHRKAQFLIYKSLEKVDSRKKQSFMRVRIFRLKIKIGKRLTKFSKTVSFAISSLKYKEVGARMKIWKRLFSSGQVVVALPSALK